MGRATFEDRMADMERARQIAHAASMVTKFEHTLAREYAAKHPTDPIVAGYQAAVTNLAALSDGGVVRGHLRLLGEMTQDGAP